MTSLIFLSGGIAFLLSFTFFKINALRKTRNNDYSWRELVIVALVDYLVICSGFLITGIKIFFSSIPIFPFSPA